MDAKEWHMHVRPPRKIDSCSRRHNNGSKLESSADLLFLPRICYSCPDLLFLHRFAQICYSWQNLLFPQSASVKWFQHKGGQLAQIKDSRTIFTIIETFQHLPSYLKFHFQHSKRATAILVGFPLEGAAKQRGSIWWHCVVSLLWLGGSGGIQCIGGR